MANETAQRLVEVYGANAVRVAEGMLERLSGGPLRTRARWANVLAALKAVRS